MTIEDKTLTIITRSVKLPVHKSADFPGGQSAWAVAPPWLVKEIRSTHRTSDQGTPLRSLGACNKVVFHPRWEGHVLHSV